MKKTLIITGDAAREAVIRYAREVPEGTAVVFRDGDRTLEQNAMLHGLIERIAKVCMFSDQHLTPAEWKLLFISGHAKATMNEEPRMCRGLEGEIVNLRESSAEMKKSRMSSLIEYVLAYAAQNGVTP
jgi:hypothetical protein